MTDHHLSDLLERAAERVPVGPAPVATMVSVAGRARRRRTVSAVVASAAVVGAVAVTSAVLSPPEAQPPVSSPAPGPAVPPDGMRFVGVGHAAIAVPEGWGTNETRCGTPQQDTVVIDDTVIDACIAGRPNGVDSVELTTAGRRFDFTADREITIDGVAADRQATTCETWRSRELCNGTIFIRSRNVSFRAESSTSAAEVDRILAQIRIVPDLVAVPGIESVNMFRQRTAAERYEVALRVRGLTAEVRTVNRPRPPPGYITGVEPPVGTMVAPGTTVTVTVAR
jgi:hypothetical protein